GSGTGSFKEFRPETVATDAAPSEWAEQVVDAQDMPYEDGSVANLIMVDVLHHLPRPSLFLREGARVLRQGGRVVMLEPYCSPVSRLAYDRLHDEPTDFSADPFGEQALSSSTPFDSNVALPTLMFWRDLAEFQSRF